jgi:hypothetical protein
MKATKGWIIGAVFMLGGAVAPAFAGAPFGGDDTGCVPDDKFELVCGKIVAYALGKLDANVIKCHLVQAGHAFQAGHSSTGFDNAEENCTLGNPTQSAKARFDAYMAKASAYCAPAVVTSANARRDTLLADASNPDSLDALNGSFYCDSTTGLTIAEPGGGDQDEAGFIQADAGANKCSVTVAKAYRKLVSTVYKCHYKMAQYAFAGKPFDEEACEETPPKGALARYNAYVQKAIDAGICPACLVSNAAAIGADAVADLDAQLVEIFPCP